MPQVKLISEWYVRPQEEVDESKRQYYLNPSDLSMLLIYCQKWGHLFTKPQNFSPTSFMEKLKLSLSIALVHFYPFAGQLVTKRYEEEHSSCIYIDCYKGPGAKLIHASALDLSLDDVLSPNTDIPLIVRSLFNLGEWDLINYDGHTKPLLSVQVTELLDGLFIGTCANHCVADGTSGIHFLKMWSEISNATSLSAISSISRVPIFQFSINNDGNESSKIIKLPFLNPDEFIIRLPDKHLRERMFHFTHTSIALLKEKANTEASVLAGGNVNVSSLQALIAFVWRCIAHARNSFSHEVTECGLAANLRPRFDPPLSQDYFGNFLTTAEGTAQVGELLVSNLGWAALLLHRAVMGLDNNVARQVLVESPKLLLPGLGSHGPNPVLITGSPMIDFYGVEFWLGRAVGVLTGYESKDGLVTAFPGAKGDRSVDLQICLAPHTMSALLSDEQFISFASHI